MVNSKKVIEKLIELAANDQIPSDMHELSPEHFAFLDEQEQVGGFKKSDIKSYASEQMSITLTDEQIDQAFFQMKKNFDASKGMDWEQIEYWIKQIL